MFYLQIIVELITLMDIKTRKTMTTQQHTPGPWHALTYNENTLHAEIMSGDVCLARVPYWPLANEESQANARLISAAPDLLSALEFLLADYIAIDGEELTGSAIPVETARKAIAKAKGEL